MEIPRARISAGVYVWIRVLDIPMNNMIEPPSTTSAADAGHTDVVAENQTSAAPANAALPIISAPLPRVMPSRAVTSDPASAPPPAAPMTIPSACGPPLSTALMNAGKSCKYGRATNPTSETIAKIASKRGSRPTYAKTAAASASRLDLPTEIAGGCGRIMANATSTAPYDTALRKKHGAMPTAATTSPPSAGPTSAGPLNA